MQSPANKALSNDKCNMTISRTAASTKTQPQPRDHNDYHDLDYYSKHDSDHDNKCHNYKLDYEFNHEHH